MLKWWQARQNERNRAKAIALGQVAVDQANAAMANWEETSVRLRWQLTADFFDERITTIEPPEGMSFEEAAKIEAIALLDNWISQRESIVQEVARFIDGSAWECLKALDLADTYLERLHERFDALGDEFAVELLATITEEAMRRGLR